MRRSLSYTRLFGRRGKSALPTGSRCYGASIPERTRRLLGFPSPTIWTPITKRSKISQPSAPHYGVIQLDEPVPIDLAFVSVSFFDVLGAKAALGRTFLPEEELPTARRVVVLSHGLWRRLFSGDLGVIGREIRIEGDDTDTFTIIGVPSGFDFPSGIELWKAFQRDVSPYGLGAEALFCVGRLKPGIERTEAKAG